MKPSPALQIHYFQKSVCNPSLSLLAFIILVLRKLCYAFCIVGSFSLFWNFIYMKSYSISIWKQWWEFWLLSFSVTVTSMLLCIGRVHSFLLLNAIPLYGCIKICLSIYMLTDMLTISHLWLLKIKLLWIFIYKSFFPVVLRYNRYTKICMKLYIWWF